MPLFKFLKSVTIPQNKHTDGLVVMPLPVPDHVYISLNQGACAPAEPMVKPGDYVRVGQLIADGTGPLSSPVHASVSGTVMGIVGLISGNGRTEPHIAIEADHLQETADINPVKPSDRAEFIDALRNSGIIDPSEGFVPLSYKFSGPSGSLHTLIVNGCECDSYMTSDYMTMMTYAGEILAGIHIIMHALSIPECVIAISDNKPDAINLFNKYISDLYINDITVAALPTIYPIGEESSLVYAVSGQLIPAGRRATDIGFVSCNVSCILKFKQYLDSGMPLVSKAVTLDGDAVARPQNVEVPVGTLAGEVIELCKGLTKPAKKIVFGGPLYGVAIPREDVPTSKVVCAILVFSEDVASINQETACIRCGKCIHACPMGLMPFELANAYEDGNTETLIKMNAAQCAGCNACSYVCPARRPLSFEIIQAKAQIENREVKIYG